MDLTPQTNTILIIRPSSEFQLIYFYDKPKFTFPRDERNEDGQSILTPQPVRWVPISIEFPIKILPDTQKWLNSSTSHDLCIRCANITGRIVEEWEIKGASIALICKRRSRLIDIDAIDVNVKYTWARRST